MDEFGEIYELTQLRKLVEENGIYNATNILIDPENMDNAGKIMDKLGTVAIYGPGVKYSNIKYNLLLSWDGQIHTILNIRGFKKSTRLFLFEDNHIGINIYLSKLMEKFPGTYIHIVCRGVTDEFYPYTNQHLINELVERRARYMSITRVNSEINRIKEVPTGTLDRNSTKNTKKEQLNILRLRRLFNKNNLHRTMKKYIERRKKKNGGTKRKKNTDTRMNE